VHADHNGLLIEQGESKMTAQRPGRWKRGESGNPKGRTPGSGTTGKLRTAIEAHVPDIIDKLVESAKAGDIGAARLLIERVLPPVRATEEVAPIEIPEGTLSEQGRAIVMATAAGELAPGQGAQLLAGLGSLAKLIETDELEARIAALEGKHGKA
jgi:Family of unknown function (DUF5681)